MHLTLGLLLLLTQGKQRPPTLLPLEQWGRGQVIVYQTEVVQARKRAAELVRQRGACFVSAGSCGELKTIAVSDGYTGFAEYFDEQGRLVAAKSWTDDGQPTRVYGPAQSCKRQELQDFCLEAKRNRR